MVVREVKQVVDPIVAIKDGSDDHCEVYVAAIEHIGP